MPVVPTYGDQQVRQQGYQGTQQIDAPAQAFGVGLGNEIARQGARFADTAQRIKIEDDDAIVKEGVLKLRQTITALGREEGGFYNMQGKDAGYESRDAYLEKIEEARRELSKNMAPGRQQQKFAELAGEYQMREVGTSAQHTAGQRKVHMSNLRTAERLQAQEDAAINWGDNDAYLDQIARSVENEGKASGWSPEQIEYEMMAALTAAHGAAVDVMIEQDNPDAAAAYIAEHADEIHGSKLTAMREKVESHGLLKTAMATADPMRNSDMTLSERMSVVRNRKDLSPEERKAAEERVQSDFRIEQAEQADERDEIVTHMWQALQDNPGFTHQDLMEMYPDEWKKLGQPERAMLRSGLDATRRTNPLVALEADGMIADPTKTSHDVLEFLKENYTSFSTADLLSTAANARKPEAVRNVQTDNAAFNEMIEGRFKAPKSGTERELIHNRRVAVMRGMYQEAITAWEKNNPNKKQIPAEDRQKILNDIDWQTNRPGGLFTKLFGTETAEDYGLDDVPIDDLERIEAALRTAGVPVTRQNVMAMHLDEIENPDE